MYGYGYAYLNNPQGNGLIGRYEAGVRSDGGSFAFPIDTGLASRLEGLGLLNASSLVNSCNAGKENVLYNLIPTPVSALDRFTVTRSTTKWVLGSNGVLTEIAANFPAFEYNTDGTYRGLLVEPAATNLLLRSQELGTSPWILDASSSVSVNTQLAPDGATTADTYTQGAVPASARIRQNYTVSSGAQITQSVFIKKSVGTHVYFRLTNDATTDGGGAWFNLDTGAVGTSGAIGTGTFTSARIEAYPNSWYRLSLTASISATTTYQFSIYVSSADNSTTRLANGEIFLWQAQAETGAVSTSPIVTTSSTANRTADSVTLTGASSLIGQASGTIYFEIDFRSVSAVKDGVYLRNSTTTDAVRIITSNNTIVAGTRRAGVSNNLITSAAQSNGYLKIAFAYSEADYALYVNGVLAGTSTTASVLPSATMTEVILGNALVNGHLNDRIRSVVLFPPRLANATLATLTTL